MPKKQKQLPVFTNDQLTDIFKHLFNKSHKKKVKMDALAYCERTGLLKKYIKKHQPNYYAKPTGEVLSVSLAKDLGWV